MSGLEPLTKKQWIQYLETRLEEMRRDIVVKQAQADLLFELIGHAKARLSDSWTNPTP